MKDFSGIFFRSLLQKIKRKTKCIDVGNAADKKTFLSGFTMAEFVISLLVIGALAMILIPICKSAKPNELDALHKKATYMVDRIVNELSTDENLYPLGNDGYAGFSNTSIVTFDGVQHGGYSKFCTLFASRINRKPNTEINCTPGAVSVTSAEGMDWYLPMSMFRNGEERIMVDLNGAEEPNRLGEDRFEYTLKPGEKREVTAPVFYAATGAPPAKPAQPAAPAGPEKDGRTAQNWYSITCNGGGATIYGTGSNKVNGTYTLVAVPNKGYKCNWFVKQVTVRNANVTDCNISCSADSNVPVPDSGDPTPITPAPSPDPIPNQKTYCINISKTGETSRCTVSGAGCGKANGVYTVTVSGSTVNGVQYKPSWTSQSFTINNANASGSVECSKIEVPVCHNITVTGTADEKANCPATLPTKDCPSGGKGGNYDATKSHTVKITPKKGYMFNNSTSASDVSVDISNGDGTVDLTGKCVPVVADKIEIKSSGLSASYGGTNTTGTTPSVSGSGDSITVSAAQDVTISGFSVVPSNKTKGWSLSGGDMGAWSVSVTSGTGEKSFSVTIGVAHFTSGCLTAKYTDNSATSNSVCINLNVPQSYGKLKIICDTNTNKISSFTINAGGKSLSGGSCSDGGSKTFDQIPTGPTSLSVGTCMVDAGGGSATPAKTKSISPDSVSITSTSTAEATLSCTSDKEEEETKVYNLNINFRQGICTPQYNNGTYGYMTGSVDVSYTLPDGTVGSTTLTGRSNSASSSASKSFAAGTTFSLSSGSFHVNCNQCTAQGAGACAPDDPNNTAPLICTPSSGTLNSNITVDCKQYGL